MNTLLLQFCLWNATWHNTGVLFFMLLQKNICWLMVIGLEKIGGIGYWMIEKQKPKLRQVLWVVLYHFPSFKKF
jgi:hypothetical protein